MGTTKLQSLLTKFMDEYATELADARATKNYKRPFGSIVRQDIASIVRVYASEKGDQFYVKGSVGAGPWTDVPWIGVFDTRVTKSARKGVYIVYLLNKDKKELYLTLNQGATDASQNGDNDGEPLPFIGVARSNADKMLEKLQASADKVRNLLQVKPGQLTGKIETGSPAYDAGCIFYIKYSLDSVPEDEKLKSDLLDMIDVYEQYVEEIFLRDDVNKKQETKEGGEEVSTKGTIEAIKRYIASKGFTYEDGLVENFFLSLKSKPFVILAGTSGTGKTRLVKLFAEAVGATTQNGRYQMVSVRPDWSDSSDLFGHVDLNGKFIPGAIIDFVKKAEIDEANPYFLCLDEMNLARVEYYLSDVLSVIETRDFTSDGKISTDPLISENYYGSDIQAAGKYGTVRLPENLYIIGTVNMDETTFPFSRKVLDRANTIEFSYVDVMPKFDEIGADGSAQSLSNSFMKAEYVHLAQCKKYSEDVNAICLDLKELNEKLQAANAHVGYRVRDEIVFYMLNNKAAGLLDDKVAFDNEIMQKILPRIQGSSTVVKEMLCELFKICAGDYEGYQTESEAIHKKMFDYIDKKDCKYKKSAAKIVDMVRRYETDGFTQYWL